MLGKLIGSELEGSLNRMTADIIFLPREGETRVTLEEALAPQNRINQSPSKLSVSFAYSLCVWFILLNYNVSVCIESCSRKGVLPVLTLTAGFVYYGGLQCGARPVLSTPFMVDICKIQ